MFRALLGAALLSAILVISWLVLKQAYSKGFQEADNMCTLHLKDIERESLERLRSQTKQVAEVAQNWKHQLDVANSRRPDVVYKWMQPSESTSTDNCGLQDARNRQLANAISSARTQYRECSYRLKGLQEVVSNVSQ